MLDHFGGTSYGIYNPASRVGSGGLSLHAEGRAADHRVPVTSEGRVLGDRIFDWLVANAEQIGLQEAQFHGRIWTARRYTEGVRQDTPANTSAHRDHVHWGQNWDGAHGHTTWYQTAKTPPPVWVDPQEEDEDMIVVPVNSQRPSTVFYRDHYAALDVPNKQVVLYNGARVAHDEWVSSFGVAVYRFNRPDAVVFKLDESNPDPALREKLQGLYPAGGQLMVTTTWGNVRPLVVTS